MQLTKICSKNVLQKFPFSYERYENLISEHFQNIQLRFFHNANIKEVMNCLFKMIILLFWGPTRTDKAIVTPFSYSENWKQLFTLVCCALFVNESTVRMKWTKEYVLTDVVWIYIKNKVILKEGNAKTVFSTTWHSLFTLRVQIFGRG